MIVQLEANCENIKKFQKQQKYTLVHFFRRTNPNKTYYSNVSFAECSLNPGSSAAHPLSKCSLIICCNKLHRRGCSLSSWMSCTPSVSAVQGICKKNILSPKFWSSKKAATIITIAKMTFVILKMLHTQSIVQQFRTSAGCRLPQVSFTP